MTCIDSAAMRPGCWDTWGWGDAARLSIEPDVRAAGEVIADQHTIAVLIDATAGAYTLTVGMYAPDTGQRLEAAEADGQRYPEGAVPLPTITVEAR